MTRGLDAAGAEFAEHDFEAASFNRIIAAAKISKGAMYDYFANQSDAYGAFMDDEPHARASCTWRS